MTLIGLDGIVRLRTAEENSYGQNVTQDESFNTMKRHDDGISLIDGISRIGYFLTSHQYPFIVLVAFNRHVVYAPLQPVRRLLLGGILGLLFILSVVAALLVWLSNLQARMRDAAIRSSAKQREAQVAQAIGRVPGVALAVVGEETSFLANSTADPETVGAHIAALEPRLRSGEGGTFPLLSTERFTRGGVEHEVIVAVARLDDMDGTQKDRSAEFVVFALDQSSKRREENRLYQLAKLASLGELATGLAHEINQPLAVIKMAAQNAMAGIKSGKGVDYPEKKLERILQQTTRMSKIIDHMRIFGRQTTEDTYPFHLGDALDGAAQTVRAHLRLEGISLEVDPSCDAASVKGRQDQIEQVLINLLQNAREAIRDARARRQGRVKGEIKIRCRYEREASGVWVCVDISDNGGGIPPDVIDKIFQPFFTTKPPGQGTGLGLSLGYGIVREHGGMLSAYSGPDGAVLTIKLPVYEGVAALAG